MEKTKNGFAMIPNSIIYDDKIGNEAKVLFCYIKSLSANYRNLKKLKFMQEIRGFCKYLTKG